MQTSLSIDLSVLSAEIDAFVLGDQSTGERTIDSGRIRRSGTRTRGRGLWSRDRTSSKHGERLFLSRKRRVPSWVVGPKSPGPLSPVFGTLVLHPDTDAARVQSLHLLAAQARASSQASGAGDSSFQNCDLQPILRMRTTVNAVCILSSSVGILILHVLRTVMMRNTQPTEACVLHRLVGTPWRQHSVAGTYGALGLDRPGTIRILPSGIGPTENLKEPVSSPNAWAEWPGMGGPLGLGALQSWGHNFEASAH
ncbi:hypothetical protein MJG53_003822 [Ovis ammon polii x Ovis aries]|uniref:Uncharacterized protein n=1 Tax=Ovis ammon polii x Ovis aries TaxID=2918886 RepID=A0ACB9V9C0_9CETA|nr:hypothetical protein MJG53_003822 [Ovis ammon polii x Ovis aries]